MKARLSLSNWLPAPDHPGYHPVVRSFPGPSFFSLGVLLLALSFAAAGTSPAPLNPKPVPGAELFSNGPIHRLRLEIPPVYLASLRQDSRKYVPALVRDEKEEYVSVGIHLKGATGSFQPIDAKPAFTLNFSKFKTGQKFHGLRKVHLNNSVEDPCYLNEYLGGELFRAAGLPAPRITHTCVSLNGRDLGLYVLKEGFTEDFLSLYFRQTTGNLYDTGDGHDVNEPLEKDSGSGPDDRSDLKALAAAAQEQDLAARWLRLEQTLELDRFISFMAMEIMLGHRDGYCLARNNFRVYHNVDTGKILFFPHGMDQLFGTADTHLKPYMSGLVAKAILETPPGKRLYRQRFGILFSNVFDVASLQARVDKKIVQLKPLLGGSAARTLEREAVSLKERIASRHSHLLKELTEPELKLLAFQAGAAGLKPWRAVDEPAGGKMEQAKTPDGRMALGIRAGPVTAASWRSKALLSKGRYRFEGLASTAGVEPLSFGKAQGATLRVLGLPRGRPASLVGTTAWQKLEMELEVLVPEQELDFICELRASKGQAWFDLDSLRLVILP